MNENQVRPNTERLTPEEVERIRREHRGLLARKDEEARNRLRQIELEAEPNQHYEELRRIRFEEEERLFKDDPRYILVTDSEGFQSYVLKEHAESRVHRKRVRKKHRRNVKSFMRDYGSIALIVIVMIGLAWYAFQLQ